MKKYILTFFVFLICSSAFGANALYDSLMKPALTYCYSTPLKHRYLQLVANSFQAWEIGRFVFNVECHAFDLKTKIDTLESSVPIKECDTDGCPHKPTEENPENACINGSIINVDSRMVDERLPITGTPYHLRYSSGRVPGRKAERAINIPLHDPSPDVTGFNLRIYHPKGTFEQSYSNIPGQSYNFIWDGLDANDNEAQSALISIHVSYYITGLAEPVNVMYSTKLVNAAKTSNNIGGWRPEIVHSYDFNKNMIFYGHGGILKTTPVQEGSLFRVFSDDGSEAYYFDSNGKHIKTVYGLLGTTKYSFEYDSTWGILSKIKSNLNDETTFEVNPTNGQVTSIRSAKGSTTILNYNANGFLSSITNPSNETHSMTYTSEGSILTFTKPESEISTFTHDELGHLISDTHSGGSSTTLNLRYDNSGYPTKHIDATSTEGYITYRSFNNNYESNFQGNAQTFDGKEGILNVRYEVGARSENTEAYTDIISYGQDPRIPSVRYTARKTLQFGRKTTSQETIRTLTSPGAQAPFSPQELVYTTTTPIGVSTEIFNGTNKTWTKKSAEGIKTITTIDNFERPIKVRFGNLAETFIEYSPDDQISQIQQADRTTRFAFNDKGFMSQIIDPSGQITKFINDSVGRNIKTILPGDRAISYSHDQNGRMTSITTPNNKTHNFVYNDKELLSEYNPPAIGNNNVKTTYAYNSDKQLTLTTLPDSRTIDYTYNPISGRLDEYGNLSEGRIWRAWGSRPGQKYPEAIGKADVRVERKYFGSLIKSEAVQYGFPSLPQVGKVEFDFDDMFRISRMLLKDGNNTLAQYVPYYFYNKDNQLTRVGELNIKRDPRNGLVLNNQLGKSQNIFQYDSTFGELSKIEYRFKGKTEYLSTFKRDKLGRIAEFNSLQGPFTLFYDESGRFIGRTQKDSQTPLSKFVYDKNGNRISGFDRNQSFTAQYDDHDRLTSYNGTAYTYDLNGNLSSSTTNSQTTNYHFDVFGNLLVVDIPGKYVFYLYDGLHRRFEKRDGATVIERYIWQDQLRLAAVMNPDNTIKQHFIYADGINSPEYMNFQGKRYHFVKDHRGSIIMVVDIQNGNIIQKLTYSEFGEVIEDTNPGFQPFGFAGGLYDSDTKLVKFGRRDYDGRIGRWLSRDPIRFNGGDANLYGYVLNDPVNFVDRNGLELNPILDEETPPPYNPRDARESVDPAYPPGGTPEERSINDALRHCIASCYAASRYGDEIAKVLGDLNEQVRPNNPPIECAQDLANNATGRNNGRDGASQLKCQSRCMNDLKKGNLVRGNP